MQDFDPQDVDWLEFDRYAVYGLGESGQGACRLLSRRGKSVVASDPADPANLEGVPEQIPDDVECVFGRNTPADAEIVVVSPGLPPDCEPIRDLEARGIPYVSELDLAFDAADAPVAALTGTDGKTTTTSLLGAIAEASSRPSRVAGNIGTALCDAVDEIGPEGLLVVEVSANQLWTCHHFHPESAGFTNVASDHLDYFESLESYREAKRRLIRHAEPSDTTVFNDEDDIVRSWADGPPGRSIGYGFEREMQASYDDHLWSDGTSLRAEVGETSDTLVSWDDFSLPGRHNRANAMCAAGLAWGAGLSVEAIREGLSRAEPLPHRGERVATVEGVTFYDDSKATNVHSALAGLRSIPNPFVAIVGGVDKGLDLEPLSTYLGDRARGVMLIGELQERLEASLRRRAPELACQRAETLEAAVERAFEMARDHGDPVILSPACSSFDMFDDYVDRGRQFQRGVSTLGDST